MACIYNEPKAPTVRRYVVDYSDEELHTIISFYKTKLHEVNREFNRRFPSKDCVRCGYNPCVCDQQ